MIIDTSALFAIMREEPDGEAILSVALSAPRSRMSAGSLIEAQMVLEREAGLGLLGTMIAELRIEIVPVELDRARHALTGFQRFGKGRHPAGLNFGDLFAHALAKSLDEPLLFKGHDFAKTDIRPALPTQ